MFSERFEQLAALINIDTSKLISKCDDIEERYKNTDKSDFNVAVDWLNTLSEEITKQELSFLLMAALSPDSSLEEQEDDSLSPFFDILEEEGFVKHPDGYWIKPDGEKAVNSTEEPAKQIGYIPAVEQGRNALGYDHSQNSLLNAIGVDEDLLNQRMDTVAFELDGTTSASRSIEALEREFTRKELAYMFTFKSRRLIEEIDKLNLDISNLVNQITIMKNKPTRKTTTKNKKDNESI